VRGEVVLVVAGASEAGPVPDLEIEAEFARLQGEGRSRRDAVKQIAKRLGLPARDVYSRLLAAR
jgi:16S rRNA (cytidine1402-2'-O)-methyltransferase